MPTRLEPASLAFDAAGMPYSMRYGDVYHSAADNPAAGAGQLQAHHVFLAGNGLPGRWSQTRQFTIVECGFGFGLNFLATWQQWRDDPLRGERLHYVAIEKHPFTLADLRILHAPYAALAPLAALLQAAWPQLTPGLHRLHFDHEQVTLTLVFADIDQAMREFRFGADAFYLDGFAPERNPEMWTPRVMHGLARLARPGATLATYSSALTVREALGEAGFAVGKRPGFGGKRRMLAGRFAPRGTRRHSPPEITAWPERKALVIGAGIAGAAAAERLAARGWRIELLERNGKPAAETSNLHAGAFHPQLSADDNVLARLTRAGFLFALQRWRALEQAGQALQWGLCGVLRIAQDNDELAQQGKIMAGLAYPPAYASCADREAANGFANCNLAAGGWWFPEGGWIRPASLVAAQLAAIPQLRTHFGAAVQTLKCEGELWQAFDATGGLIASAPVVILANSHDAARLADFAQPLASLRGQLTELPAGSLSSLRAVLTGDGYVLPAIDGIAVTGATVDFADAEPAQRVSDHAQNLAALERMLPGSTAGVDAAALRGSVGFRCAAPDRLPLIGAVPDVAAARTNREALTGAHAPDLPRLPGLYAACAYSSRGLVWSALAGELIADLVTGTPPLLEASLVDAVDPGRFVLKQVRRGML